MARQERYIFLHVKGWRDVGEERAERQRERDRETERKGKENKGVCVISLTESLYARLNGLLVCTHMPYPLPPPSRLEANTSNQTRTMVKLGTFILLSIHIMS